MTCMQENRIANNINMKVESVYKVCVSPTAEEDEGRKFRPPLGVKAHDL